MNFQISHRDCNNYCNFLYYMQVFSLLVYNNEHEWLVTVFQSSRDPGFLDTVDM